MTFPALKNYHGSCPVSIDDRDIRPLLARYRDGLPLEVNLLQVGPRLNQHFIPSGCHVDGILDGRVLARDLEGGRIGEDRDGNNNENNH